MKIISGTGHRALAERIASAAGVELCHVDITRFPDGEIFVKMQDNVRGDDLFIVQSVSVDPNEYLMVC